MNETSGTTAADFSGNGYGAVIFNSVAEDWAPGKYGNAFVATSDDIIPATPDFIQNSDYLAISNLNYNTLGAITAMTACAWIKTNNLRRGTIMSFDRTNYWNLGINFNDVAGNEGKISWSTKGAGTVIHDLVSTVRVDDNQWHHVCAVFDSAQTVDKKIYLDGVLNAQADAYATGIKVGAGNARFGFIGDESKAATYNGSRGNVQFKGLIDEARIYAYALTDPQVATLYNMPPGPTYVSGAIAANTTWSVLGSPYIVTGDVVVNTGATLTIEPGVEVKFDGNYSFTVNGNLSAIGNQYARILFTSNKASPAIGDWQYLRLSSTSALNYCIVEYNFDGIQSWFGATPMVQNSIIRFNGSGIHTFYDANPTIVGNTITNNVNGISVTANFNNIPRGTYNNNSILNNTAYNFYTETNAGGTQPGVINVKNNWWGTANPYAVLATIHDYSKIDYLATADITTILDGPGGNPVPGKFKHGNLGSEIWDGASGAYTMIGNSFIHTGQTLTMLPGTEVKFDGNYNLIVDGVLNAQGVAGNLVKFTSNKVTPVPGDWNQILIKGNGGSVINYAQIEYAARGISVEYVSPTITNNVITNNGTGIFMVAIGAVGGEPESNISENLIINNISYGIQLYSVSGQAYPQPTITNNAITGNGVYNIFADRHPTVNAGTRSVNARNNWWGTSSQSAVEASIYDYFDDTATADVRFSPYLFADLGSGIVLSQVSANPQLISPANNETSTINYTIDKPAQVTVRIFDFNTGALVKTLLDHAPRSAGSQGEIWDGRNELNVILPNKTYYFELELHDALNTLVGQHKPLYFPGPVKAVNATLTPANFDPYKGEVATISYSLENESLVTAQIGDFLLRRTLFTNQPRPLAGNIETWDGRDDSGNIVLPWASGYFAALQTTLLPENGIAVYILPSLSLGVVKANPFIIYPQYGDVTEIQYSISENANVTVSIADPSGAVIRTLVNDQPKIAGAQTVVWDGKDDMGALVTIEGNYIIRVSATGTVSGQTAQGLGNITIFK